MNVLRRPLRSPIRPTATSDDAIVIVYTVTIHEILAGAVCPTPSPMSTSAIGTRVLSNDMRKTATAAIEKTTQCCGSLDCFACTSRATVSVNGTPLAKIIARCIRFDPGRGV